MVQSTRNTTRGWRIGSISGGVQGTHGPIRAGKTPLRRTACQAAGVPTRFLHDCHRTAARNLIRASVPERVAMLLTGHKSRAQHLRAGRALQSVPRDARHRERQEVRMAEATQCAHAPCECLVEAHGPFGKYCSEHCKATGDRIELRCDCQHPPCR